MGKEQSIGLKRAIFDFTFYVWARGLQQILENTSDERIIRIGGIKLTAVNSCQHICINVVKENKQLILRSLEQNSRVWMSDKHTFDNDDEAASAILQIVNRFKEFPTVIPTQLVQMVTVVSE